MAQKTPDILKKIVSRKHEEITDSISRVPLERMIELSSNADKARGFYMTLHNKVQKQESGVIAEIKKASPSKGVLREDFDPVEIAKSYESGGASCLSILTDRDFFQGDPLFLIKARAAVKFQSFEKTLLFIPIRSMNLVPLVQIVFC
jgi:indole-3-glycerol phosphate synthase